MTATVTFRNVGRYPITIGRRKLQPGDTCSEVFHEDDVPADWHGREFEISLEQPEATDVSSRDPRGIVELFQRKGTGQKP